LEDSIDFETFRNIIEARDESKKNEAANVRTNLFIAPGSALYQQLEEIKTGEQAISFFAQHGNNTPVKFLNCNRSKISRSDFRPYDLDVVSDKELNDEYFTISAQGVVHVCPEKGKKYSKNDLVPTEFFSLSEWMHQTTMFNVLTSMKFFKHYLISKVFNLWKGNVRYNMFKNTRMTLAKNLIYSRPAFVMTFTEINKILVEMQEQKTFNIPKQNKNFELDDFVKEQKVERESAKVKYNDSVDEIIKNLEQLTGAVADSKNLREEEDFD
jgi:dynein heavy chain